MANDCKQIYHVKLVDRSPPVGMRNSNFAGPLRSSRLCDVTVQQTNLDGARPRLVVIGSANPNARRVEFRIEVRKGINQLLGTWLANVIVKQIVPKRAYVP